MLPPSVPAGHMNLQNAGKSKNIGMNNTKTISIIENLEVTDLEEENTYNMYVYFVKPGDTAWSISKNFRVSKEELLTLNELENENSINVGDRLYIMR